MILDSTLVSECKQDVGVLHCKIIHFHIKPFGNLGNSPLAIRSNTWNPLLLRLVILRIIVWLDCWHKFYLIDPRLHILKRIVLVLLSIEQMGKKFLNPAILTRYLILRLHSRTIQFCLIISGLTNGLSRPMINLKLAIAAERTNRNWANRKSS